MSDSDDYGNVSRNLRGCFPVTITSFLVGGHRGDVRSEVPPP